MYLFKLLLTVILFSTVNTVQCQIKAVTETGDEVMLAADGTWRYVEDVKNNDSVATNPIKFKKPATANFLLKSKVTPTGVWLNSKQWNFVKSVGDASEYSFSLKENSSVGAQLIIESLGMDLKSLRKLAMQNMQAATSQFKIVHEEMRSVNGLTVLFVHSDAVVQGIKINYFTYYYTDSVSTIQYLGYIAKNMVEKYSGAMQELLNGLVTVTANEKGDTLASNSDIQSSLSANSDCRALFTGNWSYTANGKKYIDRVEGNKMHETTEDKKYHTVWLITWLDKCTYVLRLLTSNDPVTKLIKRESPIKIEVLEMDTNKMTYQLSYGGAKKLGEMTKEN
jgi:hypothetical protein